jgi:hypothetical protein
MHAERKRRKTRKRRPFGIGTGNVYIGISIGIS